MTDEKSDTERVADALERLADELEYQNAILTEQARAQHLTAVSANGYSEPDERATSAPNTRSLLTMIRDNESERERAENRRLMGDGGRTERDPQRPGFVDPQSTEEYCHFCGKAWDPAVVEGFDLSAEDEYYPEMVPVCPEHTEGCR